MAKSSIDIKTNAVRLLEQAGIAFELRQYEVDENDLSAERAAGKTEHGAGNRVQNHYRAG